MSVTRTMVCRYFIGRSPRLVVSKLADPKADRAGVASVTLRRRTCDENANRFGIVAWRPQRGANATANTNSLATRNVCTVVIEIPQMWPTWWRALANIQGFACRSGACARVYVGMTNVATDCGEGFARGKIPLATLTGNAMFERECSSRFVGEASDRLMEVKRGNAAW